MDAQILRTSNTEETSGDDMGIWVRSQTQISQPKQGIIIFSHRVIKKYLLWLVTLIVVFFKKVSEIVGIESLGHHFRGPLLTSSDLYLAPNSRRLR